MERNGPKPKCAFHIAFDTAFHFFTRKPGVGPLLVVLLLPNAFHIVFFSCSICLERRSFQAHFKPRVTTLDHPVACKFYIQMLRSLLCDPHYERLEEKQKSFRYKNCATSIFSHMRRFSEMLTWSGIQILELCSMARLRLD